jgi:hypothetical protein
MRPGRLSEKGLRTRARIVAATARDGAGYISGAVVPVDGGRVAVL